MTITETYALPVDLAPALIGRLQQLLAEVPIICAPALVIDLTYTGPRCVICHEGGKLGGHHGQDGQVEWIHRACHRRLHRRGRLSRAELSRVHASNVAPSRPANGYRTTRADQRRPCSALPASVNSGVAPCTFPPASTATWSPSSPPTS